jgi:hypothetical protein
MSKGVCHCFKLSLLKKCKKSSVLAPARLTTESVFSITRHTLKEKNDSLACKEKGATTLIITASVSMTLCIILQHLEWLWCSNFQVIICSITLTNLLSYQSSHFSAKVVEF